MLAAFRRRVTAALGGRSAITVATAAGLPRDAIRTVLDGHEPKLSRAAAICDALNLRLYVWPETDTPRLPPAIQLGELAREGSSIAVTAFPVEPAELIEGEPVAGCMWFTKSWLNRRGYDPSRLVMFRVQDDSMHAMLDPDGGGVADTRQTELRANRIFLIRLDGDHLAARRALQDNDGGWLLACDNPEWPDKLRETDVEIIGEVVWAARSSF